ncbi:MAG: hypothetical protein IJV00_03980 [Clostridia bacterium]|nr:hypothetical protein [Clostridia bacterium]
MINEKENTTIIDSQNPKPKKRPFLYLIFAVVSAVILWFYVAGVDTEMSEKKFTSIPVTLRGEDAMLENHGFAVLYGKNITADITVTGKRALMTQLRQADVSAYVDLGSIDTAGEHKLTVMADLPDGMSAVCYPQSITVYADQSTARAIPVEVQIVRMTKNDDLELSEPLLSYPVVNVTGPAHLLDSIAKAVVSLDLGTVTTSFETMGSIVLEDSRGDPIESDYIRSDVKEITVAYSVFKRKTVPLSVGFVHGFLDKSGVKLEIKPESVTLRGDPDKIDALEELVVLQVDETALADSGTSTTFSVDSISLPEGIALESAFGAQSVEISVKPTNTSKRFSVALAEPSLEVIPAEGMEYSFSQETVDITVRGDAKALKELDAGEIRLKVDLSVYESPNDRIEKVALIVDQDALRLKDCYAVGEYSVNVMLSSSAATDES